ASLALSEEDRALLETLDRPEWWNDEVAAENVREPLLRAAAWYYLRGRTPRAAEFRRRYLRAGAAAIARFDGELPLRPRAHRAEPRGLCSAARRRCRQRGHAPRQGAGARCRCRRGIAARDLPEASLVVVMGRQPRG